MESKHTASGRHASKRRIKESGCTLWDICAMLISGFGVSQSTSSQRAGASLSEGQDCGMDLWRFSVSGTSVYEPKYSVQVRRSVTPQISKNNIQPCHSGQYSQSVSRPCIQYPELAGQSSPYGPRLFITCLVVNSLLGR
jgi:hypothetical protein